MITESQTLHVISGEDFLLPWSLRIRHVLHALANTNYTFAYKDHSIPSYIHVRNLQTPNGTRFRTYFLNGHRGKLEMHIGGMRGDFPVCRYMFSAYKQRGKPAIFIELPEPPHPCDNIDAIKDVVSHVLDKPPVPYPHRHRATSLSTHSTSAALLLSKLMANKDGEGEAIHKRFARMIAYSTFILPPFIRNPISNYTYKLTHRKKNRRYGESLCDRFYCAVLCLMGHTGSGVKLARLRHDEVEHMSYIEAPQLYNATINAPVPDYLKNSKKLTLVHGQKDNVACHDTALAFARRTGCNFVSKAQTFHNPFTRERVIKLCEHFHKFTPQLKAEEQRGIEEDITMILRSITPQIQLPKIWASPPEDASTERKPYFRLPFLTKH